MKQNRECLLSVIIPVYNIRDYLPRCINSLLTDRKDYEIILIDDGSNDGSSKVCDDFANRYETIVTYHKENGGVSSARNLGIEKACGQYLYFVDGDDWIENFDCVFQYISSGEEAYGIGYDIVDECLNIVDGYKYSIEHVDIAHFLSINRYFLHTPWAFIFKKNIVDELSLRFNHDLKYAEDWVFVMSYLSKIHSISLILGTTYKYRCERNGSAMNSKYNNKQIISHFTAFDLLHAINPLPCNKSFLWHEIRICMGYIIALISQNLDIIDKKYIQQEIRKRIQLELLCTRDLKYIIKLILAACDVSLLKWIRY